MGPHLTGRMSLFVSIIDKNGDFFLEFSKKCLNFELTLNGKRGG